MKGAFRLACYIGFGPWKGWEQDVSVIHWGGGDVKTRLNIYASSSKQFQII